jgi:hypothetical protein
MLRLRAGALREAAVKSSRKAGLLGRVLRRPAVDRFPMIWKEVFVEGGQPLRTAGRVAVGLLFLASFLPGAVYVMLYLRGYYTVGPYTTGWDRMTRHLNALQVRGVGTVLATLMLMAVVVRAAGSVRAERDRNTLDELLTTPLTSREILLGKWLGAMLSVRWGWAWLGLIWAVGLATGSVQLYGLLAIAACWLVYAAVGAGIGLWFSLGDTNTRRATLSALATIAFLWGGHAVLSHLFVRFPLTRFELYRDAGWLRQWQAGLMPPYVMALSAYHWHDLYDYQTELLPKMLPSLLAGVGCWAGLIPVLWVLVKRRFERVTGRGAKAAPGNDRPRGGGAFAAAPGSPRSEGIGSGAGVGDGRLAHFEVLPVHLIEHDGMPGRVTLFRGDVVLARPTAQAQLFDEIQIDLDPTHGNLSPTTWMGGSPSRTGR